ncbi:BLOC-2 complex member HPS5 homolog [Toxorhynchites rutilus septentrionalis]|uniref:BLOC-2 complex member HPS5 homolog n=1 Tax=Toxorhynchites rutilus septentrionalis TaxID=329112 RepID=UPI00247923A9|nr:BLOC-2 complex member HPS5 homolog [Toxorhynchites rutilus septentrionalis]
MIMEALKHYGLSQRTDLSQAIYLPLRNTKRIKFTCFDVSEKYLIFGANSGSLYIYDRATVNFLCIIPSQLGTISQMLISGSGKQIAVANLRGTIGVVLDLESSGTKEVLLTEIGEGTTTTSKGAFVTCFCWGEDEKELYCGDSKGTVSLLQLSMFMGRNILNITLNPVLLLDNQIVQIDRYKELLLVSTMSKCVLCNTVREEFKQIGNRPRDGPYGGTFIVTSSADLLPQNEEKTGNDDNVNESTIPKSTTDSPRTEVRIFCSRPGSRLWEADVEGNVLQTHQFRQKINGTNEEGCQDDIIAFKRLHAVLNRLILVHDDSGIFLIDPIVSRVVLSMKDFEQIERIAVVGEDLYVFNGEQKLLMLKIDIEQKERPESVFRITKEKKNSPFRENGVYILDHLFNNNGSKETLQTEVTIKEALVSVVRGKYGRNIKQMFLGYDQIGPERPKTLNVVKTYNSEENYNNITRVLPTEDASPAEEVESGEEVVPKRNPPKKMFSMSLLNDYQLSEDDKDVRNLYLVYRSSSISNLNFADRYAKIFDSYDSKTIVSLLRKLENVMDENDEDNSRLKCIRIYFDYLKVELVWEIDAESRAYIKESFIEYNQKVLEKELRLLDKCESCGHCLRPNASCHYLEIGTTLVQYYWSRKEYAECFELVRQIPYLWHTIAKFYIQDRREDKMIQCLWNVGDCSLLEWAASELFLLDHWRQLLDLMLTCYNSNSLMCLNCDKLCTLADAERNPLWGSDNTPCSLANRNDNNNPSNKKDTNRRTHCSSTKNSNTNAKVNDSNCKFYSWNYVVSVAINSGNIGGKALLNLLRGYDEYIPKGAISTSFYLKCLLNVTE